MCDAVLLPLDGPPPAPDAEVVIHPDGTTKRFADLTADELASARELAEIDEAESRND